MKCNKCGNEIPIESEFCSYCGNKVEKEEKKTIKLSLKKIIIIEIIVILGIAVVAGICVSVWTRPQISKEETTQNVQNNKIKTYELNKIGYYKNENILEEKYNNNGDLIYCKYKSGNEIKEDTYNYEYDSQGRTIKVSLNNGISTLEIEYAGEEISKITTTNNNNAIKYVYVFMEDMDENKFINEYYILNQQFKNESVGQITDSGRYLFFSENIDKEKYNIVINYDKNNKLESYKIYKEGDGKYNSSLNKLGFVPIDYVGDIINSNNKSNLITSYWGFSIYYPIINQGNEIYTNNQGSISKKIYDSKGRILYNENQGNSNNKWFYKYNDINSKTYEIECLVDGIDENNYKALGMKSQYVIEKIKCYLDDENKIYKYEMYEDEEINQTEALKLEKEYLEYINNNKVDSDNIISVLSKYLNLNEEIEEEIETQTNQNKNTSTQQIQNTNIDKGQSYNYESYEETQYTPPNVVITSPSYNKKETDDNDLTINYYVEEQYSNEISIVIKNNGKVITNKKVDITYNYWSGEEKVELEEGTNKIEIIVTNSKGKSNSATYEIKFEYKKPYVSINNSLIATDEKMFELSYGISDKYDTELSVTIKNNGKIITNKKVSTNGAYWKKETIELEEGINKIEVIVTNSKGKSNSAKHEIEY